MRNHVSHWPDESPLQQGVIEGLAAGLKELIDNRETLLHMSDGARFRVQQFSWSKIVDKIYGGGGYLDSSSRLS